MDNPQLRLGPMLRYVDETAAAIWVEVGERGVVSIDVSTDGPATTVTVEAHTFTVHDHHYALVDIDGLVRGASYTYAVRFGGEQIWPAAGSAYPASRIQTLDPDRDLQLVFGSCRTSAPQDPATNRTHGVDVLRAFALRMVATEPHAWPSMALLLGDQVYADETSEMMQEFIAARRDIDQPPGNELKDFEEYAHLYKLAWTEPANRWLLSTLPTAMIFDDHDIRDDWNTSAAWRTAMRAKPWWHDRIIGGLVAYWVYQHIGNLSRVEREADAVWCDVVREGRDGDAGALLDAFAERTELDPSFYRWSYHRDIGGTRLLMLDTRAARVLEEGARRMTDDVEMAWLDGLLQGSCDHLLIGTSLPFLLPMGLHHFEAWNEALCEGAWGPRLAVRAEKLRQLVDLEHWAAFQTSFQDVARAVVEVATGRRGEPPATVCFLSGDVHHSYLAEADLGSDPAARRAAGPTAGGGAGPTAGGGAAPGQSRLLQAVCSPIRNQLPQVVRFASATSAHSLSWPMGRLAARSANVQDPPFRWSITEGPWFDNALATLHIEGRRARMRWDTGRVTGEADPTVVALHSVTLS